MPYDDHIVKKLVKGAEMKVDEMTKEELVTEVKRLHREVELLREDKRKLVKRCETYRAELRTGERWF